MTAQQPEALRLADAIARPRTQFATEDIWDAAAELRRLHKEAQIASHAKRLALELESLLLATHDTEAVSTWWQSAYQAMHNYQDDVDRLYPQDHVSPLGKD